MPTTSPVALREREGKRGVYSSRCQLLPSTLGRRGSCLAEGLAVGNWPRTPFPTLYHSFPSVPHALWNSGAPTAEHAGHPWICSPPSLQPSFPAALDPAWPLSSALFLRFRSDSSPWCMSLGICYHSERSWCHLLSNGREGTRTQNFPPSGQMLQGHWEASWMNTLHERETVPSSNTRPQVAVKQQTAVEHSHYKEAFQRSARQPLLR